MVLDGTISYPQKGVFLTWFSSASLLFGSIVQRVIIQRDIVKCDIIFSKVPLS